MYIQRPRVVTAVGCRGSVGHPHHRRRCSGVDREVAARRAVCRASRLPCSRCTCTDARTDAASPCRRRRCRRGRSVCPTSSARSDVSCVSLPRCGGKPCQTPTCSDCCNTVTCSVQMTLMDLCTRKKLRVLRWSKNVHVTHTQYYVQAVIVL